jgi:hypothetical protein
MDEINPSTGQDSSAALPEPGIQSNGMQDVESLIEGVLKPDEIPVQASKPAEEPSFEIKWRGKVEKMPLSKAQQLAQKGYDYEQNIAQLKREREEFEAQRKQMPDWQRLQELKQIDDYARQHPEFLKTVQYYWNQRQQLGAQASNDPAAADPMSLLKQEVETIKSKLLAQEQKVNEAGIEQEGRKLDTAMGDLRKQFDFLDWDKADDFGYDREHQLLKHISETGMEPKKAFWQLFGEEVSDLKAQKAVQQKLDEIQTNHKRGVFLGKELTRSNAFSTPKNMRDLSYDQIAAEIMKSHNIAH